MCPAYLLLITFIREASVVDLPLPVGPVTRTSPLFFVVVFITASGIPNDSGVGIWNGNNRSDAAYVPLCLNTLRRKRPTPLSE